VATQHLETLTGVLEELHLSGSLTFPEIRQAVLNVFPGAIVYRPTQPLMVGIGNVGYMQDSGFVLLKNVKNTINFEYMDVPSTRITCTGGFEMGQSDGSGILK